MAIAIAAAMGTFNNNNDKYKYLKLARIVNIRILLVD